MPFTASARSKSPSLLACLAAVVLLGTGITGAHARAPSTHAAAAKNNARTFKLAPGSTKKFSVAFPDALKFGDAKYSGQVQVLAPSNLGGKKAPIIGRVRVLSKGSAQGGSVYSARVRNGNSRSTAPVRVRIAATTTRP